MWRFKLETRKQKLEMGKSEEDPAGRTRVLRRYGPGGREGGRGNVKIPTFANASRMGHPRRGEKWRSSRGLRHGYLPYKKFGC
jgi:hypothetical protein